MKYLVTHFYSKTEIPFLKLNFLEGKKYVDKFVFVEFNYSKRGAKKKFVDLHSQSIFTDDEFEQILYFKVDLNEEIKDASDDTDEHRTTMAIHNEPLFRSYFTRLVNFQNDDIIISVDADEIIHEESYNYILNYMKINDALLLKMNMFYYRLDYLSNEVWTSPIAMKYKYGKNIYDVRKMGGKTNYPQWRKCSMTSNVKVSSIVCGSHFSWCMSIDSMCNKFESHGCGVSMNFKNLNNVEVLENAVKNKAYIFKTRPGFKINHISINSDVYPKKMKEIMHLFFGLYKEV